ncbi:MAG: hypothetical protein IPH93_11750 [Saprospiraceae bacterium]|nr:hypothetical protein [Saprospiraceae bacterium]MBK7812631.1 hypothetical protein [Saprospiraceae bacterium]MBK9630823.1 hypothetical protein [Saprospiraceae bacterium]
MNTSALITWLLSIGIVTAVTVYLFVRILRTPPKKGDHEPPPVKSFDAT